MDNTDPIRDLKAEMAKHDEFADVLDDIGATLDALREQFKSMNRTFKEAIAKVHDQLG